MMKMMKIIITQHLFLIVLNNEVHLYVFHNHLIQFFYI